MCIRDRNEDVDIIGQFGVGFYAAFMVSDDVTVESRAFGSEEAWKWESHGVEGYTIEECAKPDHGTVITLHIKPNSEEENYDECVRMANAMAEKTETVSYTHLGPPPITAALPSFVIAGAVSLFISASYPF